MQHTISLPGQMPPVPQFAGNGFQQWGQPQQLQQQQQQQQQISPFSMNPVPQPLPQSNPFGPTPQQFPATTGTSYMSAPAAPQQYPASTGTSYNTAPQQYPASTGASWNPFMSSVPATPATNPYQTAQQAIPQQQNNPYQQQQLQQSLQQPQLQTPLQQQPLQQQLLNPYQQQPLNPYQEQPSFPQQQQIPYQRPPVDKSSILALFNAPQLAPPRAQQQIEVTGTPLPPQQIQAPEPQMPGAGSNNPFLPGGGGGGSGHRSQESVDFGAWQSGRHSPDAFASLAFGGR